MSLKTKIILYIITIILFISITILVHVNPYFLNNNPDLTLRGILLVISIILYIPLSYLWFNEELSLKLLFIFKLKEFDINNISDFYIFMDRLGLYLALLYVSAAQFLNI